MFVEYDSCVILLRLVKHVLVYVSGTENAEFKMLPLVLPFR